MLSDYESYIFSLRDNLIQCGVDLSADIKENTSYKDLFFLSLKISDILFFYRVMAVSPDYALRGFMLPLNKNYKDVIRGISYGEFVETILPDYRVLTGDNGDYDLDEDLDDDEDFDESDESDSESGRNGIYAEQPENSSDSTYNSDFLEFGDDLYASMFGSEDDDISDMPSDTEETVEIASRLDTPVENGIYSTNIGGSYVEDIPLPDIEEIDEIVDWLDEDYDYVDHGSYIEDIKPVDTADSEIDNVGIEEHSDMEDTTGSNDSEDSNGIEDVNYVPNGIYLEEYNPSSNGYNNEETVWDEDVEGEEGYSEDEPSWDEYEDDSEEVSWDEPEESDDGEVTWDDSEEEVTWDEAEESDDEEVTWDEPDEETWDESEEETWDEPDEEDGAVTWDDSEEEEVWDEPDEEDVVEPAQEEEEAVSTEAQETQVSGGKETEKSLKDRLFGTDDLGEAVQGVTNSVLTKLKRSTISFLNGRSGKV